jgi:hypothetical protein
VKTGRADVLATSYVGEGKTVVALASWAKEPVDVDLAVDWTALGLDSKTARLHAPAIEKFQEETTFVLGRPIRVEPGKGWLIVVERGERR